MLHKVVEKVTRILPKKKTNINPKQEKFSWIRCLRVAEKLPRWTNAKKPPNIHPKVQEVVGLMIKLKTIKKSSNADPEAEFVENVLQFIEGVVFSDYYTDGKEVINF